MIPTLVACTVTIVLAVFGGGWLLSGRVARVEQMIKDMPKRIKGETLETIQKHCRYTQSNCYAKQSYGTNPHQRLQEFDD